MRRMRDNTWLILFGKDISGHALHFHGCLILIYH